MLQQEQLQLCPMIPGLQEIFLASIVKIMNIYILKRKKKQLVAVQKEGGKIETPPQKQ